MITQLALKRLLTYEPDTGDFFWRANMSATARAGQIAGSIHRQLRGQYRKIVIEGRDYQAHRLAVLYMTGAMPPSAIDHRDRDGLNNRWGNLRHATPSQNSANAKRPATNTSGFKGVTELKKYGKWQAAIKKGGKSIYLGVFPTPEEAHDAYVAKARELFGEYARAA